MPEGVSGELLDVIEFAIDESMEVVVRVMTSVSQMTGPGIPGDFPQLALGDGQT